MALTPNKKFHLAGWVEDSPCLLDPGGLRGGLWESIMRFYPWECHPLALAYTRTGIESNPIECHDLALDLYLDNDSLRGECQPIGTRGESVRGITQGHPP